MIFYFNSVGAPVWFTPERIFQGSNKANDLYFVSPSPPQNVVTAEFLLPDGKTFGPELMTFCEDAPLLKDNNGNSLYVWHRILPQSVTALSGGVSVQFKIASAGGEILATAAGDFLVERGVSAQEPEQGDSYRTVIDFVAKLSGDVENFKSDIKDVTSLHLKDGEGTGSVAIKNADDGETVYAGGTASGIMSAALGCGCESSGDYSFAVGNNTRAVADGQTAAGEYNIDDESALFVVGNGTPLQRQNAFTVKKDGRATVSGQPSEENDVANKKYVDAAIIASVSDSFSDASATRALSAKKGKELKALIDTKEYTKSFPDISLMISHLNACDGSDYWVNFNFNIVETGVPDFWVVSVEDASVQYNYTDDDAFVEQIKNAPVQVGYYKLSYLETAKMDLSDYVKFTDTAKASQSGVVKVSGRGLLVSGDGLLGIHGADNASIDNKTDEFRPLTPKTLDYAVKKAMDPTSPWSEAEKTAARQTVGALSGGEIAKTGSDSPTSATAADFVGQRFVKSDGALFTCTAMDSDAAQFTWHAEAVASASLAEIDLQQSSAFWISPQNFAYAVKKALTQPEKSSSPAAWTDDDRAAARTTIGVYSEPSDIVNLIYPVGSIYMSVGTTAPSVLFGGVWEKIENRFLLAAGSSYAQGSTGGEATHTLTVDEMPSHNHAARFHAGKGGNLNGYDGYLQRISYTTYNESDPSVTVLEKGGSQAHNNMPPYLAVNMWKRIS